MKQLNKNIFWNALGNTAYNGLQWLITVIVARKSGLEGAGILSAAMSLTLTFRTVAYFGIRNFQVSDSADKYSVEDYGGLRIITSGASLILCIAFAFFSGYGTETLTAIFWYMVYRMSESASDLFHGAMQKNERLDSAGICLLTKAVVTTAAFMVTFFGTNSLYCGLCAMSLSAVVVTFFLELPITAKACGRSVGVRWGRCSALAAETAPLLAQFMLTAVMMNAPKYLLSLSDDEAYLGAYASVFSVMQIMQALFQYMYVPFTTEFTRLSGTEKSSDLRRLTRKILLAFGITATVFSAVMQIFGMPVLALVFGEEIRQYRDMLLPVAISVCAYSVMNFMSTLKTVQRDFRTMLIGHAIGAVACVAGSVMFMNILGANGESYGLIVGAMVASLVMAFGRKSMSDS